MVPPRNEPPEIQEARRTALERLSNAQFWWETRCAAYHRKHPKKGPQVKHILGPRGESRGIILTEREPLKSNTEFLRRLATKPGFWADVSRATRSTSGANGRHQRGPQHEKRRRVLVQLWLQLMTTGDITSRDLDRCALTPKAIRTWKDHKRKTEIPPVLVLSPNVEKGRLLSLTTRGAPSSAALKKIMDTRFEAYDAGEYHSDEPAASTRGDVTSWGSWSWSVTPEYIEDFLWVQQAALAELDHLRVSTDKHRLIVDVLRRDFLDCWWPLESLTKYVIIDVAIDWWLRLSPMTRKRFLGESHEIRFTPSSGTRVVNALKRLGASPAATAMVLSDGASSLYGRKGEPRTFRWRRARAAYETALRIEGVPPLVKGAVALNYALFLRKTGHPKHALRWQNEAEEIQRQTQSDMMRDALRAYTDSEGTPYSITRHNVWEVPGLQMELVPF